MSMHCDRTWGGGNRRCPYILLIPHQNDAPACFATSCGRPIFCISLGWEWGMPAACGNHPDCFLSHCSGLVYATISKRGSLMADLIAFWLLHSFHPLFCGVPWALLSVGAGNHTMHCIGFCICVYVSFSVMVSGTEEPALCIYVYICILSLNPYIQKQWKWTQQIVFMYLPIYM